MSFLTIIIALFREVWPFFKEALLEGQTFGAWLRNNWLTFIGLAVLVTCTLNAAYLVDVIHRERQERVAVDTVIRELPTSLTFIRSYMERQRNQIVDYRIENERLTNELTTVQEQLVATETELGKYRTWMTACGVDFERGGQCRVRSTGPPRRKPAVRTPPAPTVILPPAETVPEEKPGFWKRLRDTLGGEKKSP